MEERPDRCVEGAFWRYDCKGVAMTSVARSCSHAGCERDYFAAGFCQMHYKRDRQGRDMDLSPWSRPSDPNPGGCPVVECGEPLSYRGLCARHANTARRYNLTLEQLNLRSSSTCQICGERDNRQVLSVDHDHSCCPGDTSCGECVRGFLCDRCNRGLGYFRDNIALLRSAIEYLDGRGILNRV